MTDIATRSWCCRLRRLQAKSAELATLADAAGVKTQIGLQRPFAPAFRYVHDLVAQGYVGKVRSARMHVSVNMFGKIRANAVRWSLPIENFMSVVAIFGGHFFPVPLLTGGKAVQLLGAHGQSVSRGHH